MIRQIEIDNFKSLSEFRMTLSKFTCLVGLNGAGKTTLLQAIDFLSHLMKGTPGDWILAREWTPKELTCRLPPYKRLITFRVHIDLPDQNILIWEGKFNPYQLHCTWERVSVEGGEILFEFSDNQYRFMNRLPWHDVKMEFQGSILGRFKPETLKKEQESLFLLRVFIESIRSMELMSPHFMRKKSKSTKEIGTGGENLSAFLHGLSTDDKKRLQNILKDHFMPTLHAIHTQSLWEGWKQFSLVEHFTNHDTTTELTTEARHVNDGALRQIAMMAQTLTDHRFLLFDEIENGMNPEKIEKLVELLLHAGQQIMVTTHNPLILNYLPDDVARESVILVYRTPTGHTRSARYFDLPIPAEKLAVLGPGEVYVDTYLEDVVKMAIQDSK